MKKFLVIQTAFIGDVILATAVLEKLHDYYHEAQIDVLVRNGNESLLENHPFINNTLVWHKKKNKYRNLFKLSKQIRHTQYDYVINLHRFGSSGFLTWRSGAKEKIGFDKNPFSKFFTRTFTHEIGNGQHEVERNQKLIAQLTDTNFHKPKLYPTPSQIDKVKTLTQSKPYIVVAPASVWFTKQVPQEKIVELIQKQEEQMTVYLIGAPSDLDYCQTIIDKSQAQNVINLAGKLSLLESAALIGMATMNYVNDSAPLHLASAMNAPVKAFFCSTVPEFGFGPLSEDSEIIQVENTLHCRPCGLHGHKSCPEKHFKCGFELKV